jgi:hypothetical protein
MNCIIRVMRRTHIDYWVAVQKLQKCIYDLNIDDEGAVIKALEDGLMNGTNTTIRRYWNFGAIQNGFLDMGTKSGSRSRPVKQSTQIYMIGGVRSRSMAAKANHQVKGGDTMGSLYSCQRPRWQCKQQTIPARFFKMQPQTCTQSSQLFQVRCIICGRMLAFVVNRVLRSTTTPWLIMLTWA